MEAILDVDYMDAIHAEEVLDHVDAIKKMNNQLSILSINTDTLSGNPPK